MQSHEQPVCSERCGGGLSFPNRKLILLLPRGDDKIGLKSH